jgi:hypothetical protein
MSFIYMQKEACKRLPRTGFLPASKNHIVVPKFAASIQTIPAWASRTLVNHRAHKLYVSEDATAERVVPDLTDGFA